MSHPDPRGPLPLSRRRLLQVSSGAALALATGAVTAASRLTAGAQEASTPTTGTLTPPSSGAGRFLDAGSVHRVGVSFEQSAYDAMIETYTASGDKDWIEADVTIDGATYPRAGMRLKGNSSLGGLRMPGDGSGPVTRVDGPSGAVVDPDEVMASPVAEDGGGTVVRRGGPAGDVSADTPEALPWLIRLDKYVDDQAHEGIADLVIRSNGSATSLNEAVALDLLAEAGLDSQLAAHAAFTVNGGVPVLRLAIELPNDAWMAAHFSADGLLYKSEAGGDWSYRGEDPDAYDEIFELEAGGTDDEDDDLAPLIDFLDFVNNSDDAAFVADLTGRLDVDRFADYRAMMTLLNNFDDIAGPGNNSYLYAAPDTGRMTVVPWDMNLAFGGFGGGLRTDRRPPGDLPGTGDVPNLPEGPDASTLPSVDGTPVAAGGTGPDDDVVVRGGPIGAGPGGVGIGNPLVERFDAVADLAALVDAAGSRLRSALYDSGVAESILARRVAVLESGASTMVDRTTITSDAVELAAFFAPVG